MKKLFTLIALLGLAQSANAANISTLDLLSQSEFRTFSEDLGAAFSYKPVTPAAPLGTIGFDMGIEVTQTDTSKSAQIWSKATSGGSSVSKVYVPKLHIAKGLPFGIDIAAFYSKIPTTNISLVGAELRYAIVEGGIATPAIAVRGSYTKLGGVDHLSLNTKALDFSISKGFAMFTPYAGIGEVWVDSSASVSGTDGALSRKSALNKIFAGANLNLGATNIAAEVDKTGGAQSISMKLGFRF